MALFKVYKPKQGYEELVNPKNSPLKYIKFGVLSLQNNKIYKQKTGKRETAVVVLSGSVIVTVQGRKYKLGKRKDVFSGKPEMIYIPINESYEINAVKTAELVITSALGNVKKSVIVKKGKDLKLRVAGRGYFERHIFDLLTADDDADALLMGETFHIDGGWSCIPPHKHDKDRLPLESNLEEVYFFKITPENGFGFERLYSEGEKFDKTWVLKNNTVLSMPFGYHALTVSPGYRLYYFWVLAGKKRILKQFFDPRYDWLNKKK